MIYATFDIEVLDDPSFQNLEDADPGNPWRFMRCVQVAKRANERGRIQRADGVPLDARALSRLHEGRGAQISVWEDFLNLACKIGLIEFESGCYRICHWKRWHRAPSDEPEAVAERKRRSRDNLSRTVTSGHECHETEQSRAEQSKAEQIPPTPKGAGEGEFLLQSVESMENEAVAVRLRSLDKLSARLNRKLRSGERRKAEELLSRRTPSGLTPVDWHRILSEAFSAHFRATVDEANLGKRIGSIVSIACTRTEEQLSAYLLTNGRTS